MKVTLERLRFLLDYDAGTGLFTRRVRTGPTTSVGQVAGFIMGKGYVFVTVDKRQYQGHRLAWFHHYGQWPADGLQIDHIDRDRSNNRISNLRAVTGSENCRNKAPKPGSSGIVGVTWNRNSAKWQAQFCPPLKTPIYLGIFDTKEAAAQAYQVASRSFL